VSPELGTADLPDARRARRHARRYETFRRARSVLPPVWDALSGPGAETED
jgi:hypothetical protein